MFDVKSTNVNDASDVMEDGMLPDRPFDHHQYNPVRLGVGELEFRTILSLQFQVVAASHCSSGGRRLGETVDIRDMAGHA